MRRLKSLTGVLHMPEIKVNFHLSFDEREPKGEEAKNTGEDAKKIGTILDQFSNLSPEIQEIIIEFAEFLEHKAEKPGGQGPTT